jgi:hypothetical protein
VRHHRQGLLRRKCSDLPYRRFYGMHIA